MTRRILAWTLFALVALAVPNAQAQTNGTGSSGDGACPDDAAVCLEVCPATDLEAEANGNGTVTVTALVDEEAELWRSADDAEPQLVGTLDASQQTFLDTNVTAGIAYTYYLVADTTLCAQVDVGHVPVFGTPFAIAAAVGVGSIGYAVMRRRP